MGNPHVGFDEAGAGNGLLGTAPAFDPTDERAKGMRLTGNPPLATVNAHLIPSQR